ncbi:partial 3-phosphoshikimate 1-carboxyvinyltransferase 1, partial [Anaerolineae bacterium]
MSSTGIFGGTVLALPAKGLKGQIRVPGDKSISHRSVFF